LYFDNTIQFIFKITRLVQTGFHQCSKELLRAHWNSKEILGKAQTQLERLKFKIKLSKLKKRLQFWHQNQTKNADKLFENVKKQMKEEKYLKVAGGRLIASSMYCIQSKNLKNLLKQ
jgi:hypothetical protein